MARTLSLLLAAMLAVAVCRLAGASGDGLVRTRTAAPSCPDGTGNIYVDCGNGTVTDARTGLVWLQNADCLGTDVTWSTSMAFVAGLADMPTTSSAAADDCGLSDGSSPGEWRLPSREELTALIANAVGGPGQLLCDPTVTNDQGTACWSPGCFTAGFCSFQDIRSESYWTSTTHPSFPIFAGIIELSTGDVFFGGKLTVRRVWPVRSGQ